MMALQLEKADSSSDEKPSEFGWPQGVGIACACVGLILAAGGGIGGGGILVPVYVLVMQFSPKVASIDRTSNDHVSFSSVCSSPVKHYNSWGGYSKQFIQRV